MFVRELSRDAAAGRALEKTDLEEIRFVNIFDGVNFLAQNGGDRIHANRPPAEAFDDGAEKLSIDVVEAVFIHIEKLQRIERDRRGNFAVAFNVGIIANSLQQAVRDARRSAASS